MKNAFVVLVILTLLGVGGYFYLTSRGMMPKAPLGTGNKTGGNVFTSIKDALSKSLSLKCVYKDEKGVETTTYIKGGAVRVMMARAGGDANEPNNIIMNDKKMHMWSDVSKTGFTYTIEEPKNITPLPTSAETQEDKSGTNQEESVLETIEKYKDACKPEVVADSLFTVPTDVKFQDMNALQQQMMKQVPQAPQGGSEQDYQQYIQQMIQQQGAEQ